MKGLLKFMKIMTFTCRMIIVYINGVKTNQYTFKQDYYWLMGDNRSNSQDSRSWGFVPFDHVVGKPVFKWLSIDYNGKGI